MFLEREIVRIVDPIYYLKKGIVSNTIIEVWKYNNITSQREFELEKVSRVSVTLFNNQFSINEDQSILYFPTAFLGNFAEINYYTEGNQNPFDVASNQFQVLNRIVNWSNNRIIDGLFLYKFNFDEYYIQRIKEGSFVLNGVYYTFPAKYLDFRGYGYPTIKSKFRGIHVFINQSIILGNVFNPSKSLTNPGILVSSSLHEEQEFAKIDVIAKYTTQYGNEPRLDIAFIYILQDEDANTLYWFEYPSDSRLL